MEDVLSEVALEVSSEVGRIKSSTFAWGVHNKLISSQKVTQQLYLGQFDRRFETLNRVKFSSVFVGTTIFRARLVAFVDNEIPAFYLFQDLKYLSVPILIQTCSGITLVRARYTRVSTPSYPSRSWLSHT